MNMKKNRRKILKVTAETFGTKRKWKVAEIAYQEDLNDWIVSINEIDSEWWSSHSEFFDTQEEAVKYATENADVAVMGVEGKGRCLFLDLELVPEVEHTEQVYFDCARKMDVRAEKDGILSIYTDLAYTGAGARKIRLTKEQAMWLMELLPEAIASFPEFGWEDDVRKSIKMRRKEKKEKEE